MIRTVLISSLLMACTIVHADDREIKLGLEQEYIHRIDSQLSRQEYEEISNRNRRFVLHKLRSYSENTLEMIGMSESGINLIGTALGLALNGSRLNLYKSKALSLKLNDVSDSDRALYLEVDLDW